MSRRPPHRSEKPPKRHPYAGPISCLRCDRQFRSWDRRQNRLCPGCREAIEAEPSDESPLRLPTRWFRHLHEG
jgi:hypothetical protein